MGGSVRLSPRPFYLLFECFDSHSFIECTLLPFLSPPPSCLFPLKTPSLFLLSPRVPSCRPWSLNVPLGQRWRRLEVDARPALLSSPSSHRVSYFHSSGPRFRQLTPLEPCRILTLPLLGLRCPTRHAGCRQSGPSVLSGFTVACQRLDRPGPACLHAGPSEASASGRRPRPPSAFLVRALPSCHAPQFQGVGRGPP